MFVLTNLSFQYKLKRLKSNSRSKLTDFSASFSDYVCFMDAKLIQFNLSQRNKERPELRAGDWVKVHRKIQEGKKERIQIFEGMVIAIKGGQSSSPMITVRKVSNGVGVEIIIPVYSPSIEKIELVKRAKVRRAKLYYIREKTAKSLRFKFTDMADAMGAKKAPQSSEDSAGVDKEKLSEKLAEKSLKKTSSNEKKKTAESKKSQEVEGKTDSKKVTEDQSVKKSEKMTSQEKDSKKDQVEKKVATK